MALSDVAHLTSFLSTTHLAPSAGPTMSQATLQFSDSGSWTPRGLRSHLTAAGPAALHGHLLLSTSRCFPADQSIVYKGTLTNTSTAVTEASSQDVVCKYREGDISGLEHEARIYQEKLANLQGTHVPRFLGLFRGLRVDETRREKVVACLILTTKSSISQRLNSHFYKPVMLAQLKRFYLRCRLSFRGCDRC